MSPQQSQQHNNIKNSLRKWWLFMDFYSQALGYYVTSWNVKRGSLGLNQVFDQPTMRIELGFGVKSTWELIHQWLGGRPISINAPFSRRAGFSPNNRALCTYARFVRCYYAHMRAHPDDVKRPSNFWSFGIVFDPFCNAVALILCHE